MVVIVDGLMLTVVEVDKVRVVAAMVVATRAAAVVVVSATGNTATQLPERTAFFGPGSISPAPPYAVHSCNGLFKLQHVVPGIVAQYSVHSVCAAAAMTVEVATFPNAADTSAQYVATFKSSHIATTLPSPGAAALVGEASTSPENSAGHTAERNDLRTPETIPPLPYAVQPCCCLHVVGRCKNEKYEI
jgi:hypothetical protein